MKRPELIDVVNADGRVIHTSTEWIETWEKKGYRVVGSDPEPKPKRKYKKRKAAIEPAPDEFLTIGRVGVAEPDPEC